jgi:transcriptional regulator with XRE-family HTH domain
MTARAAAQPAFARVIREGRAQRELRQHVVAARLGFSTRTLSRWERGESLPQGMRMDDFLARLAELDRTWADQAAIALGLREPPPARDLAALRRAAHDAFYAAAERANLPPASLRAALDALFAALAAAGLDLAESRAFLREPPA